MSRVYPRGPAWAARDGDVLTGELSYRPDGKKPARRRWQRTVFDAALTAWFDAAADADQVEVVVDIDGDGHVVQLRMARPPVCHDVRIRPGQAGRAGAVRRRGQPVHVHPHPAPRRAPARPGRRAARAARDHRPGDAVVGLADPAPGDPHATAAPRPGDRPPRRRRPSHLPGTARTRRPAAVARRVG